MHISSGYFYAQTSFYLFSGILESPLSPLYTPTTLESNTRSHCFSSSSCFLEDHPLKLPTKTYRGYCISSYQIFIYNWRFIHLRTWSHGCWKMARVHRTTTFPLALYSERCTACISQTAEIGLGTGKTPVSPSSQDHCKVSAITAK